MGLYIKTIEALIIICLILSALLFFWNSQQYTTNKKDISYVIWRYSEYCYVAGHHRKDLDIIFEFSTIEQCEEYLFEYR